MERQLDAEGARLLYAALEAKGMRVLLGAETQTIEGPGKVQSVLLKDGRLRCDSSSWPWASCRRRRSQARRA